MKKLISILMSCMLITSAFASCGSDGGSDSDSASKGSISGLFDDEEDTTEADDDDDDEDTTTAKKTTKGKTTKEATTEADDDESDSEFVGKWELVKIEDDGEEYTEQGGVSLRSFIRVEFDEDGNGKYMNTESGETIKFTWDEKSSSKVHALDEDGDDTEFIIKSGYLVVADDEDTDFIMYFEKVTKYTDYEGGSSSGGSSSGGSSSGEVDSKLVGTWETEENGFKGAYNYKADGMGDVILDSSELIYLDGNTMVFSDNEITEDMYSFKNGKFVLDVDGENLLTMTKISGSKNDLQGTFQITAGYLYDQYEPTFGEDFPLNLTIEFDGSDSAMVMADCYQYTADGSDITIVKGKSLFNNTKFSYTIKGDTLTLSASGAKQELTRAD